MCNKNISRPEELKLYRSFALQKLLVKTSYKKTYPINSFISFLMKMNSMVKLKGI